MQGRQSYETTVRYIWSEYDCDMTFPHVAAIHARRKLRAHPEIAGLRPKVRYLHHSQQFEVEFTVQGGPRHPQQIAIEASAHQVLRHVEEWVRPATVWRVETETRRIGSAEAIRKHGPDAILHHCDPIDVVVIAQVGVDD